MSDGTRRQVLISMATGLGTLGGGAKSLDAAASGITERNGFDRLQDAYDALPDTGGTVLVPNGYAETFSSDLYLDKPNCGFLFAGSALLSLGMYRVVIARTAHSAFMRSLTFGGNRFGEVRPPFNEIAAYGVRLDYRGEGKDEHGAIEIGDTWGTIEGVHLEGLCVRTDDAARGAWGIIARGITYARFDRITISNAGAGALGWEMGGLKLSGIGEGDHYCGYVEILSPRISGGKTGIATIGQVNHSLMFGGTLNSSAAGEGRTIGIHRDGNGSGLTVINTEVASWDECLHVGSKITSDNYLIRTESDAPATAHDAVVERGATRNVIRVVGGCRPGGGLRKQDANEPATTNDVCMMGDQAPCTITLPQGGQILERMAEGGARPLLGSRRTGWGRRRGMLNRDAFDPATVRLEELAERVAGLIEDLTAHGLIGP